MLLAQSYYHQQPLDHQHHSLRSRKPADVETRVPIDLDDIDIAIDIDQSAQLGQFPEVQASTQSLLPQLSALFNFAAPSHTDGNLPAGHDWASLQTSHQPALAVVDGLDGNDTNMMQHGDASWLIPSHITPKSAGRFSHQRESSLSSLGSAGPASPYSHNSSNPQIAVTDSAPDTYHGMPSHDDFHYQLASKVSGDGFYGYQPYPTDAVNTATTAYLAALRSQREADRGLLPPPEYPTKSRPVSVASSVNSESPATPALLEPEDDGRRNRNVMQQTAVPKLARTMTDIYSDELYNPNFTITSAPPSQPSQLAAMSPTNEIFAQRLQAANSQHLSAAQSPVSSISRGRSPFRQGSPLAPAPSQEFPTHMGAPQLRFGSAQKAREQRKAELDAQARQQLSRGSEASTPQTISPKDALLDYHDGDGDSDFPLFPQPSTVGNVSEHANSGFATGTQGFHTIGFDSSNVSRAPAPAQLPLSVPLPQHYPFISQPRQPVDGNLPLVPTLTSRISSMDSNVTEFVQRPHAGTGADGGTYTCTYHGCTLRFETPAMLQKHKREGHRQAHGLGSLARHNDSGIGTSAMVTSPAAGMTSSLLNTQAGPHKCERINPSTGKPCNTIFSRPYDLTRHEDTIHNARKQKVRCDLCTDEKTFSRADALTRHYRVCHPEVEFPGKARRRSARGT